MTDEDQIAAFVAVGRVTRLPTAHAVASQHARAISEFDKAAHEVAIQTRKRDQVMRFAKTSAQRRRMMAAGPR